MKQLALEYSFDERNTFDSYVAGDNQHIVDQLRGLLTHIHEPQVLVWSKESRGKTHLLQALIYRASQQQLRCAYVPLSAFGDADPALVNDLWQLDIVCVDDVNVVVDDIAWCTALFNLINECRSHHKTLVFASRVDPKSLTTALPDLKSRLLWGPVYHLCRLNEMDLMFSMRARAEKRGIEVSDEVLNYLLTHSIRDIGHLLHQLDDLDQAGLEKKRKLTLPLVKSVLGM